MCVWRERKPEAEFLNFLGPQPSIPRNWFLKGTVALDGLKITVQSTNSKCKIILFLDQVWGELRWGEVWIAEKYFREAATGHVRSQKNPRCGGWQISWGRLLLNNLLGKGTGCRSSCFCTSLQHSTAHYITAQHSSAQHNTAWHSTAQHSTTHYITAHHSTLHHSTAQHSTTQHSTTQHSTTQHSIVQPPQSSPKKLYKALRSPPAMQSHCPLCISISPL